ncbi:unnamed protein product [Clavelina lepadiformis]|uniref:Uncharacterized protein n=1 Tax=Clavelina lepadiformis TaxID=159417 RepID=A0ABP0H6W2_CLALP
MFRSNLQIQPTRSWICKDDTSSNLPVLQSQKDKLANIWSGNGMQVDDHCIAWDTGFAQHRKNSHERLLRTVRGMA